MSRGSMRQRSPGSWELKYDIGHDPINGRRRIRYKTAKGTKRGAQQELRRLLGQVDEGIHADPGKLTLGDYLDRWLDGHRVTISARTREWYAGLIKRHIKPDLGTVPLAKLTTLTIDQFYAHKLTSGRVDGQGGLGPQTVRHIDRVLHVALRGAVKARLIAFNPVNEAKRPKVERGPKQALSDEEFKTLLKTARGTRLYTPLVLLVATGLRRGELLALQWRNVDLHALVLFVVAAVVETKSEGVCLKPPKTAAGQRRVDLPHFAVDALREHQVRQKEEHLLLGIGWSPDTLVFDNGLGQLQRPCVFTRQISNLSAKSGVKFTPHLLRHDHFSRLLKAGVHPKIAQARAGHSSIRVTLDVYSHACDTLQREATERMDNAFSEIHGGGGGNRVANGGCPQKRDLVKG